MDKEKIYELKIAIKGEIFGVVLAAQKTGMLSREGTFQEFCDAKTEERKAVNRLDSLVDKLAKEALNEDN